jgi:rhomboid protease GluP
MELFEQGDVPAAVGILQGLRTAPPRIARPAMLQLCRFSNDWPELVRWVRATIKPNQLLKDPAMLPMYIRALGETGQLSEMLRTVQACSLSLHPQMTVYRGMCRMYAFVFCGQPDRAAGEMSGSLVSLPGYLKQYWIATAEQASGMNQAGDARLESIELIAPAGVARMIAVRRMNPATAAMRQLSAGDHEILHQLDRDQDQERRFVPLFHRERRPWVTYGLIAANVIMFGFEMMLGGTTNPEALFRLGAMVPGGWEAHEYYRLLAANFLHYGLAHITMNMLGLLVIGPFVEFNLGWLWYLVLYLATGILTMLSIVFFWSQHWMEPDFLVGASGAIMALIGATAAILLRGWYRERAGAVPRRLAIVAGMILLQATFDHFTPQVSGAAHMAGAAWGFLITLVLPHRKRVRPTRGFEVVPVARG